ncbi:hypothetical protein [Candidatus Chromulinivorax destructor]|uniref:Uncharacterized protein n=1 Tax=Candidatus Chromulinivorax destructor TaxID=2066483 RepID=A0A345ZAC5_9BACT|nr:hypothetical protein [Candidatus Chromulinivorax destructor]AXK60242.1 hypothetical protein C0J27_00555 [Candidatus Chromulinivorax destructor]
MQTKLILNLIACVSFVDTIFTSQNAEIELAESFQTHGLVARVSSKKLFQDVDSQCEDDLENIFISREAVKIYFYLQDLDEVENCHSCTSESLDVIEDYCLVDTDEITMNASDHGQDFFNQKVITGDDMYTSLGLSYFDGEKEVE